MSPGRDSVMTEIRRILPTYDSVTGYTVIDLAELVYGASSRTPSAAQLSSVARALRRLVGLGVAGCEDEPGAGRGKQRLYFLAPGQSRGDIGSELRREPISRAWLDQR